MIVDEIPKGPTGKIQRLGLSTMLADALEQGYRQAGTDVERAIIEMWEEVLDLERVGADDNFFALGGDSLRAMQVIGRIRNKFGVELPVTTIFLQPTIEEFAQAVTDARGVGAVAGHPGA